jgi:hypothetical protein
VSQPPEKHQAIAKRDRWDWFKLFLEIVALVALVIYTFETRRTNNLTKESLDLVRDNFRKDQRPYVWLRNDLLFPAHLQVKVKDGSTTDERATWDWHFTDYGKTPALHVKFISRMNTGENALTASRALSDTESKGAPLPPGKDDFSTAISPTRITKDELNRLIEGFDGSVVVYGRIEYTDAEGTPYESGFCFHTLRTHAVSYCKEENTNYIK